MIFENLHRVTSHTSIEGNIGAGKSFLLAEFGRAIERHNKKALATPATRPRDLFVLVKEPDWSPKKYSLLKRLKLAALRERGLDDENKVALLGIFYADKEKNAFLFQVGAFTSRIQAYIDAVDAMVKIAGPLDRIHVISERSMISDQLFMRNLYEDGTITDAEYQIYLAFYQLICPRLNEKVNTLIYLDTKPAKCQTRVVERDREAETGGDGIPLDYLQSIHDLHLKMLEDFTRNDPLHKTVIWQAFNQDLKTDENALGSVVSGLMERVMNLNGIAAA